MKISICIATYNGAKKLSRTLDAICKNLLKPHEVIVYIDGSTDNTVGKLESYANKLPLRIIKEKNNGRATARNNAFTYVTGEIVLFLDDDIIVPENALETHLKFHKSKEKSILSSPSYTLPNKLDFSNFKVYLEKKWNKVVKEGLNNTAFSAAYFSIRKSDFAWLGGFRDGLNDAEDFEFGVRVRKNNIKIVIDYAIYALHNDDINCKKFILRNRQYLKANKLLLEKNILDENPYVPTKRSGVKKIFYYFLASKRLVKWIDNNSLVWLYEPFRYKLYDYISASLIFYYPNKNF